MVRLATALVLALVPLVVLTIVSGLGRAAGGVEVVIIQIVCLVVAAASLHRTRSRPDGHSGTA